jgi:hypothetical protein
MIDFVRYAAEEQAAEIPESTASYNDAVRRILFCRLHDLVCRIAAAQFG